LKLENIIKPELLVERFSALIKCIMRKGVGGPELPSDKLLNMFLIGEILKLGI
jgi:hypothetical protein